MTFAKRLKHERTAAGLTQEVLSGLCGISQRTWCKYERGTSTPMMSRLLAISDVLGCSADYLLGRTDERKNLAL